MTQSGEQGCNVTRNAWVAAGLPWHVPATSVDRQCGSSQQAMHFVAQGVIAGAYDLGIACGVESMTRAPMSTNARGGVGPFSGEFLRHTNNTLGIQFWVAQVLADRFGVTREEMDAFALESHRARRGEHGLGLLRPRDPAGADQGPRDRRAHRRDARSRRRHPARRDDGVARRAARRRGSPRTSPRREITAGNASQMSDGASAMLIADRATAERLGLPIRARFVHFAVAADDPVLVLSAPNPVTRKLLERTGMKIDEFDAMECNEAFAAIALMWAKEFQPDPAKLNPRGGAIAIGHPLGASGVRLMTTMLNDLETTGGRFGFQTMCEGGGQANATVIERLG